MTSRPKILLPPEVEAWYAEAMRKCDEATGKTESELQKWWKDADGSWHKYGPTQWEITGKEAEVDG